MKSALLVLVILVAGARAAAAYPQFQLARDTTCTACHVTPDGGTLLNENGESTADAIAWKSHDPQFMYGKIDLPDWLKLGGDFRAAGGFVDSGLAGGAIYPMQADVYAQAGAKGFTLNLIGGLRRPQKGASALHAFWSRQHYVMWQQKPGESEGLFIRVGRLAPTFGLRLAEHVVYTERYGGFPLFDEAYAVAASYVTPKFEVHATGFVHDSIASAAEHGDGAALYAEARIGAHYAVGAEAKFSTDDDQDRVFAGVTGKWYCGCRDLLILGEAQYIHRRINVGAMDVTHQFAAYVMAVKPITAGLQLDVGAGHFNEDLEIHALDRTAFDANIHWYMTSHIEWLLTTRLELLNRGEGPNGGYALAQLHYRL